MFRILFLLFLFLSSFNEALVMAKEPKKQSFKKKDEKLMALYEEYAKFYDMPQDSEIKEITNDVLNSALVKERMKQEIRKYQRRIFVFTYPSDGLKIKGLISFVPDPENHPLLVVLRGGNRTFGVLNPGDELVNPEQYTVIAPMYRGGVSEGEDEFGGDDVNDVKSLVDYIPELEKKFSINVHKHDAYLLGGSRGGMQMFLALARFPELQSKFSKVVSLSGMLDMRECIAFRADMEEMFINDFGLEKGKNEEDWINRRDPILTVPYLNSKLPILIIQGTKDKRVSLEEGYNMVNKLQAAGKNVTYWEIDGADHCLRNKEDSMSLILRWLEQ